MKITDKVVTSKGRFGTIENIDEFGIKAHVRMGLKVHEILLTELNLLSDTIPINVVYVDKFDSTQIQKTEVLNISKNTTLYDLQEELYNDKDVFMNQVKTLLIKRLNNHDLLILKIKLL